MNSCTPTRTCFAELLRSFYLGRITNIELEDAFDDLEDAHPDLHEIFYLGVYGSYSDNRESKFTDNDKFTSRDRKIVARWILFLKSDQPYKWPLSRRLSLWIVFPTLLSGIPLALWTWQWQWAISGIFPLMLVGYIYDKIDQRRIFRNGDKDAWPFFNQVDLDEALRNPPYLSGQRNR